MKRIIILCLILSLLLACVPTPETEPIAQKDSDVQNAVSFTSLSIPKHITADAVDLGIANLSVDADIILPDNAVYGVSEVREGRFDRATVTKLLEYFADGRQLYLHWEDNKAEIYQELQGFETIADEANETDMMLLQYLREAFENAPMEVEHVPFALESVSPSETLCSLYAVGENNKSFLSYTDTQFIYNRDRTLDVTAESEIYAGDPLERLTPRISREDAEKAARDMIDALHIDHVGLLTDQVEGCAFFRLNRTVEWGYRFLFTPLIGNIPCGHSDSWTVIESVPPSVGAPWPDEWIEIYVGQDGVMKFAWSNPASYSEPDARDAFVPFDKMLKLFENQLLYMYAAQETDVKGISEVSKPITIDQIRLVRGTIQKKDDRSVGLNVPLWAVRYTMQDSNNQVFSQCIYFDAFDGTYVEPRVTYKDLM